MVIQSKSARSPHPLPSIYGAKRPKFTAVKFLEIVQNHLSDWQVYSHFECRSRDEYIHVITAKAALYTPTLLIVKACVVVRASKSSTCQAGSKRLGSSSALSKNETLPAALNHTSNFICEKTRFLVGLAESNL